MLEKGMMTTKATTVIGYIVQRIADEGVEHCFGVPGDYAFPVGDAVDRNPNIKWIKGIIMENAAGVGSITPAMVEARARELALINGHGSTPNEADWEEAKRELTGEEEVDPQEKNLESLPESENWDPLPGSTGRQAAVSLGEDEDAEGRSEAAQMYEEGINEAEHDQMVHAAEDEEKNDELET
jgi:thiamine pyrophosphate-dependent enzyme